MKLLPFPAPRPRLLLPVALACTAAAVGGWLTMNVPSPPSTTSPSGKAADKDPGRAPKLTAEEAVGAWTPAARAGDNQVKLPPGITITGQSSPARAAAFHELLAQLRPGNAAEIHRLLISADQEGAGLADTEWRTLLEKWGRLDGAAAADYLGTQSEGTRHLPGLLRGWAAVEPEVAAAWLEDHVFPIGGEAWKPAAQRELILGWFAKDPQTAAGWLNAHNGEPGYDGIAAAFAEQVATIDPENALEWAASTGGPEQRRAIQSIARQWLEQDEKTAQERLQAAGYSLEEIRSWEADPSEGYDLLDPGHKDLPGLYIAEDP